MNEPTRAIPRANPEALANVAALLVTHLMAHLLKTQKLTHEDVSATFLDTRKRYTSTPVGQEPKDDRARQVVDILANLNGDVGFFAQQA